MTFKVRPFARTWSVYDAAAVQPLRVSGTMDDAHFLISIGQAQFVLAATNRGADRFGPYIHIVDQTIELGFGWRLIVEPGDDHPGCRITLEGDWVIDVYFNDAGVRDGGGTNTPAGPDNALH